MTKSKEKDSGRGGDTIFSFFEAATLTKNSISIVGQDASRRSDYPSLTVNTK